MTKRARKTETRTDIAAVLILQYCKTGDGKPLITRDQARNMTGAQILREWRKGVIRQHGGAHATGGSCEPFNIWYTPRAIDAVETPRDISRIAKGRRIQKKLGPHRELLLSKIGQAPGEPPLPARKKAARPIPGSRGTPYRKRMNGTVERRT